LLTYSPSLARRLAASVSAKVQETFAVIDQLKNVSPSEARELIHACFAEIRREIDLRHPYIPETHYPEMEIEEQAIHAEGEIARLADELEHRAYSTGTTRAAERALALRGTDMKLIAPEARSRLLAGFTRLLIEKQRFELARLRDPLADYQPFDPLFSESIFGQKTLPQQVEEFGPSVESCIKDYLASKKPIWAEKTFVARSKQLGYLQEFLGPHKLIVSVTTADVRAYRNTLTMLRSNRGRAKPMTFMERLTENTGSQISNKSASIIFEPTKAFFRWAKEEEGILTDNPAGDVRWQSTSTGKSALKRRPFSADELATLFGSPLFTGSKSQHRRFQPGNTVVQDARYWIPIIGFYTGMRLGEIVQLHISDVALDADVPHLDLNEESGSGDPKHIKTAAGIRQVPIHSDVLELGFAAFVEKRQKWGKPCKRIFSEITLGADGQASTQFSKFFARLMDNVGLTDPTLTFHSFRHGAEDAFRNANLQQYTIDSIMGHSDGKVSSEYGVGPSLTLKAEAVQSMNLPVSLVPLLKSTGGQ